MTLVTLTQKIGVWLPIGQEPGAHIMAFSDAFEGTLIKRGQGDRSYKVSAVWQGGSTDDALVHCQFAVTVTVNEAIIAATQEI